MLRIFRINYNIFSKMFIKIPGTCILDWLMQSGSGLVLGSIELNDTSSLPSTIAIVPSKMHKNIIQIR